MTSIVFQRNSNKKTLRWNIKNSTTAIKNSIWRRITITTAYKRKYVLAVVLTIAIGLISRRRQPKLETISNDFLTPENDELSIDINSLIFRSMLMKPRYYPWYPPNTEGRWNYNQLWGAVAEDNSFIDPNDASSLYIVHNGRLFGHIEQQQQFKNHALYRGRIRQYEQLISFSLALVQRALILQNESIDSRLQKLVSEPFPFYIIFNDFQTCKGKTFPFFTFPTFAKHQVGEECVPLSIPTYEQWNKHKHKHDWSQWDVIFKNQGELYPWNAKINKAVWRGSTTGDELIYTNWRDLPRSKLVRYSLDNPSILDAAFMLIYGVVQRNETEKEEIVASGFAKPHMWFEEFQKYKAVIDIDGNSWSSRFAELLCLNSVVIKVEPTWVDYFYSELQPWVHYVPVNGNLSNLVEVTKLVMTDRHQQAMRRIVRRANDWCRSKLTATQMAVDMVWIMTWYVELLTKEDIGSGSFTKWKHEFSQSGWNSSDWVEILIDDSLARNEKS